MRVVAATVVGLLVAGAIAGPVGGWARAAGPYAVPSAVPSAVPTTTASRRVLAPVAPLVIMLPNDSCATPTAITTLPFTDSIDTTAASTDPGDPTHSCGFGASDAANVWYTVTAPGAGILIADTTGSDYDTVLAAYTGACDMAAEVVCSDNLGPALQAGVGFPVAAGQQLLIEVSATDGAAGGSLVLNVSFVAALTCPPPGLAAGAVELLVNGDFESGTLDGWTETSNGDGNFVATSDPFGALSTNLPTAGPACGSFYALTDQVAPGTHALTQSFEVPTDAVAVTLAFDLFADDQSFSGGIVDPIGLDHTGPDNQHTRVDILASDAGPFDGGASVLRNLYLGVDPGLPANPYTRYSFDITDVAAPGGTFILRFAETDNRFFLHLGVDNVSVAAQGTTTSTSTSTTTSTSTSTSTTLPLLLPGGKKAASDCYLEVAAWGFASLDPSAIVLGKGRSEATCTDGDACDFGPCGDGVCSLQLEVCVNQSDPSLAACSAPEALDRVKLKTKGKNKGLLQLTIPQSLAGAFCFGQDAEGTPFRVSLPAATQKKNGKLKGGTLDLGGFAKAAKGTKPRKDPDAFRLRCAPRTAACPE